MICHAAGLRPPEWFAVCERRSDSERMVICVEEGKGREDCYVMLWLRLLDVDRISLVRRPPEEFPVPGDIPY